MRFQALKQAQVAWGNQISNLQSDSIVSGEHSRKIRQFPGDWRPPQGE
jgi:hypothetical protein